MVRRFGHCRPPVGQLVSQAPPHWELEKPCPASYIRRIRIPHHATGSALVNHGFVAVPKHKILCNQFLFPRQSVAFFLPYAHSTSTWCCSLGAGPRLVLRFPLTHHLGRPPRPFTCLLTRHTHTKGSSRKDVAGRGRFLPKSSLGTNHGERAIEQFSRLLTQYKLVNPYNIYNISLGMDKTQQTWDRPNPAVEKLKLQVLLASNSPVFREDTLRLQVPLLPLGLTRGTLRRPNVFQLPQFLPRLFPAPKSKPALPFSSSASSLLRIPPPPPPHPAPLLFLSLLHFP